MVRLRRRGSLTGKKLGQLKAGKHSDGGGLYLLVTETGARRWLFVAQREGKRSWLTLGPLAELGLQEARRRAEELRATLAPKATGKRASGQLCAPSGPLFAETMVGFLEAKRSGWGAATERGWRLSMAKHVEPVLGALPVAQVGVAEVLRVLEPIWAEKPNTARRIRGQLEAVLDWATVRGQRPEGANPAAWKGRLEHALARPRGQTPHPAMPWREVPALVSRLLEDGHRASLALVFLILTAARTGEVVGARWNEVVEETWTIPAGRMKAGREHIVPLSEAASELLRSVEGAGNPTPSLRSGLIFGIGPDAMARRLRLFEPVANVHGFRSSFRDWAADQGFPFDVAEACLAHRLGSGVERRYLRTTLIERRAELLQAWGMLVLGTAQA